MFSRKGILRIEAMFINAYLNTCFHDYIIHHHPNLKNTSPPFQPSTVIKRNFFIEDNILLQKGELISRRLTFILLVILSHILSNSLVFSSHKVPFKKIWFYIMNTIEVNQVTYEYLLFWK